MSLCPACSRISVPNLTHELDDLSPWLSSLHEKSNTPRGMVHLEDAQQLVASASGGCAFCSLIVHAALQETDALGEHISTNASETFSSNNARFQRLESRLVHQPIYLQINYDPVKPTFPEEGQPGSWRIRGLKALLPVDHSDVVVARIRLYATADSRAGSSCDIIGRPRLSSSDSPEAYNLIERWMNACLTKHQACRESFSGTPIDEATPPELPSRVIYVGEPGTSSQKSPPRLLETAGRRGHYVALSHCWGPPAHRPLMTLQSSLAKHLTGIPWDQMPTTYQHAITATRRLGFEYIWIDSLCILQDSHDDWLRESQRMGQVYQYARLTIAASHAAESSQPCFFTRPAPSSCVVLPKASPSEQNLSVDRIFASVLTNDYTSITPEAGPLAFRAWATQEWLLSRRMIFYTAESLVWSCKTVSQRETGASFHSTARNARWKNLVEKYSARQLTKQTDRLIALEGIRGEMAKKRGDDIYCFGLWKNSMPDQLLWYCLEPGERSKCELDLPTWTWASTLHGVRFIDIQGAKNACDRFRFDEQTQALAIQGALRKISHLTMRRDGNGPFNFASAFPDAPHDIVSPNLQYTFELDDRCPIGWCLLDDTVSPTGDIYCLRLMSKSLRTQHEGQRTKFYSECLMLLQLDDEDTETYKRIGIGKITTQQPCFQNCGNTTIFIR